MKAQRLFDEMLLRMPRVSHGKRGRLVLAYHNVVPDEISGLGDSSLHLSTTQFASQIDLIKKEADLVELSELLDAESTTDRLVAVTFDDAYQGCLEHGVAICTSGGARPTVFVSPLLCGRNPHWDLAAHSGQWNEAARREYLWKRRGTVEHAVASQVLPSEYSIAALESVRNGCEQGLFFVGNHTAGHVNLAALSSRDARDQVVAAFDFLRVHGISCDPYVAYPYGLVPPVASRSAIGESVQFGFAASGGWASRSVDPLRFPRLNVPSNVSLRRFAVQLRGWLANR
jgi:peptidoglycan/xylan/chitin deacetylase (PgdA/CDA1 family)